MGFIIPTMGMKKAHLKVHSGAVTGLADALFTKVQQRVLGVLFGNPGRSFYANELIALAGCGTGAVQRELTRLAEAGLVTVTRIGRQKHYQANAAAPVFEELRGLVLKTSGLADVLKERLSPLADQIEVAFVYGSIARGEDTATSDIDLMVVSDSLTHADLFGALEGAVIRLGRRVNPTVYSPGEFAGRIKGDNAFVMRILSQPKLWLIGEENDLGS
jgi:predicted nucleotidyltransferase